MIYSTTLNSMRDLKRGAKTLISSVKNTAPLMRWHGFSMSKVNDELNKFMEESLKPLGNAAIEATKEVIDEEARSLYENIKAGTPVRTGGLVGSLAIKRKTDKPNRYGYVVAYEGYNEQGVPYSKIARTLNKGTKTISAIRHIDRAIRKLKGIDDRIVQRFIDKTKGRR